jgi:UDP-N-acetylmuramyl-tripeptide synthetase
MKLSNLLKGARLPSDMENDNAGAMAATGGGHIADVEPAVDPGVDPDIGGVYYRAQDVAPGGLFVAVKGFTADGHDFIGQAVERGAVAVVCERPVEANAVMVPVDNTRKALAAVSTSFYDHPSRKLTLIGITGTNGKTTTSYLIESILARAGLQTGVIGTINYRYCGQIFDNPVTTPESLDVQRILADMCHAGVTHAVMEVSSHALDLHRVYGCAFDMGVLTNFTQDHLDYHKDMETYWSCKRRLFTDLLPASAPVKRPRAVINSDDPRGRALRNGLELPLLVTGQNHQADIQSQWNRFDLEGISARIKTPRGVMNVRSPLVGRHNLENILNAVGVGISLELSRENIAAGIEALDTVPGRLERIPNRLERFVYVDYAHTPDALENALLALRSLTADRILCVFGCGGDRDRDKRPQMGAIAARLSDLTIVTSDNPRTEPPEQIIAEIENGVRQETRNLYPKADARQGFAAKGYVLEPDRRAAIALSIQCSRPGDTVLIAGKGHEPYQIIGTQKFDFDDRKVALEAMAA